MAARLRFEAPTDTGEQRLCARGRWCAAATRDTEDNWQPARTYQAYCQACMDLIVTSVSELPGICEVTAEQAGDPFRSGGKLRTRTPPGPRVLASLAADALLREAYAVAAGWAARVRALPSLRLSAPAHRHGTPERLAEDAGLLSLRYEPLLALAPGWTTRVYDIPEGRRPDTLNRAKAVCRKCGKTVTRSPASGWWWAPASPSAPTEFCDHDPGKITETPAVGPIPADTEADIGDEEIVAIGLGWVKVTRLRDGCHAGAEFLDMHWRARKISGRVPARPEPLDGVPCRECEELTLVRAEPPSDPALPAMHSCCTACRDEMTREEFADWAKRYDAWAKGAGILNCRRCELGKHRDCCWPSCSCKLAGHARLAA